MELPEIKVKASEAFARGKFAKAGELYESYCAKSPKDLQSRLRMGDAWAKAGEKKRAISAYASAAEAFAREGFLPRAIAASKLILELDPAHQGVQQMLAALYAQKGGPPPRPAAVQRRDLVPEAQKAPAPQATPDEPPARVVSTPAPLAQPRAPEAAADLPGDEGEELVVEDPVAEPSASKQAASALPEAPAWEGAVGTGEGSDMLEAALALAGPAPSSRAIGDLEASLQSLAAARSRSAPEEEEGVSSAPEVRSAGAHLPSFTELELSGDSLLHALELAAGNPPAPGHPAAQGGPASSEIATEEHGALPRIPLFSDLPAEAFIELFERCPLRRFKHGERILEQGTTGDAFYVICEGAVRIFRTEGGTQKHLAQLKEGAFFGEMALLSGAPRAASVESVSEETQLLEISATVLEPLARRHPTIAQALRKFCRQRLLSNLMDTSELFRPFNRQDRRVLVERFRARDVRAGETLVEEGHRSDGLYVVLSGEVSVQQGETPVARLKEGEIFGEMSLLTKTPAMASVRAAKRTSLLRLPREDFDALILSHPQILVLVSELTESRGKQLERVSPAGVLPGEPDEPLVMV